MKPPKIVYVGTYDYDVRVTRDLPSDLMGETESSDSTILLRKGQSPANLRETLVHEVLHAILYASGIAKALDLTHDGEEKLVVLLAPWLTQLIQENPELIDFVTEQHG